MLSIAHRNANNSTLGPIPGQILLSNLLQPHKLLCVDYNKLPTKPHQQKQQQQHQNSNSLLSLFWSELNDDHHVYMHLQMDAMPLFFFVR